MQLQYSTVKKKEATDGSKEESVRKFPFHDPEIVSANPGKN